MRVWLFPATYAAHLLEESLAGEGFPTWLAHVRGSPLPWRSFAALNAIAFAIMCAAALAVQFRPHARQLVGVLGTIVCTNAMLHLIGSVATHRYSPGVVTAAVLWTPLGAWALWAVGRDHGRRALVVAVAVGLAAHTALSAAALFAGR